MCVCVCVLLNFFAGQGGFSGGTNYRPVSVRVSGLFCMMIFYLLHDICFFIPERKTYAHYLICFWLLILPEIKGSLFRQSLQRYSVSFADLRGFLFARDAIS